MSSATMSKRFGVPFGASAAIHSDGTNANTAAKPVAATNNRMYGMHLISGSSPPVVRELESQREHRSRRQGRLSEFRNP